ncbi:MAG TPA: hypothetical protein PK867_09820 [Pirellulales bacterium]|nr:hypothetical protein [Pirellulales bacterium]
MNGAIKSRLAKLEAARREADVRVDDPNRPKHLSELLGGPYDPTITLPRIFQAMEERMARELAAGTYRPPEPPDPDYMRENVVDVDSYILKLEGDRDGWKARQVFLKRDLAEMIRQDWPDIDAEPATKADDNQEPNPPA